MFRVKIGLVGAGLVVAVMVFTYLMTVMPMDKEVRARTRDSVLGAATLVQRMHELKLRDLADLAEQAAARKDFVKAVQTADEDARRKATFIAVSEFDDQLRKDGRKAHFLGVVDKNGAIVARDLDANNLYGEKLPFKSVQTALQGVTATDTLGPKDIFWMKNKMMRLAAAPIRGGGDVKGAVVIAYEVTAAEASELHTLFGTTDVAYFMDDAVRASSFSIGENTEDAGMADALSRMVLSSPTAPAKDALAQHKPTDVLPVKLRGENYLLIAGPLPMQLSNPSAGFVVLSSLTDVGQSVSRVRWVFLGLTIVMLLLVLGGMWLVAKHFVDAEDKLELGVTELINGNLDYSFDVVEEFEGLANGLNVMLARLLGRPEPGEEGGEDPEALFRPDVIQLEELDANPDPNLIRQLAAEPEDAYYARIHAEYVDARRRFNLPVDGITLESLTQKLRANEALLRARHKAQMIRFAVQAQPGKVSLKPIRIG